MKEKDNTAHWVEKKAKNGHTEYYCSKCGTMALGYPFWELDLVRSEYCPKCGKKMDNPDKFE